VILWSSNISTNTKKDIKAISIEISQALIEAIEKADR
jgi:hypothetical protein